MNVSPLPLNMSTKLKYVQEVIIAPTTGGTAAIHFFRANDLYDPDYTTTGH
jgi:hypothetical protein